MKYEAVMPGSVDERARKLLLRYVDNGQCQEELSFGLWHRSTGESRHTGILFDIIPPQLGERKLHGNASFSAEYLARSVSLACARKAGLAFMHNHFTPGWQDMSKPDVIAERDR
ncbi:MAG: hypothetical protein OXE78_00155, partial [Gammaproteobacteria bacterium]|nr:hypothetical protein [Gammaproteobacteria bacterium]